MKKILTLAFISLILTGCNTNNNVDSTVIDNSTNSSNMSQAEKEEQVIKFNDIYNSKRKIDTSEYILTELKTLINPNIEIEEIPYLEQKNIKLGNLGLTYDYMIYRTINKSNNQLGYIYVQYNLDNFDKNLSIKEQIIDNPKTFVKDSQIAFDEDDKTVKKYDLVEIESDNLLNKALYTYIPFLNEEDIVYSMKLTSRIVTYKYQFNDIQEKENHITSDRIYLIK